MSEKTEGDFIKLAEKDTSLQQSFSYKKYKKLDTLSSEVPSNGNEQNPICRPKNNEVNDLTVRYQLIPGKNIKWDQHNDQTKIVDNYYCNPCDKFKKKCKTEAYDFCKLIRKNLEQIYAISPGKERKKHCLYYKNWFYGKLMNMFNSDNNSECFNSIITEFTNFKAYSFYGYIDFSCQYDLYGIDKNKLKLHVEKKYLHDYFNNYDMIDNSLRKCEDQNNNIYKEYLNSISVLYEKYKSSECTSEDHNYILNNCENYFDSHEYYNPQNLLSIVEKCIAGKEIPEKIKKEKYLELGNSSPQVKLKCTEGAYLIDGEFVRSMICSDKQKGDIVPVGVNKSPSFSYYQIIFTGIFTLIGVFFLLFLFYKFTSCRNMLQKSSKKKHMIDYNINMESSAGPQAYKSESREMNQRNKRIHIAYQTK